MLKSILSACVAIVFSATQFNVSAQNEYYYADSTAVAVEYDSAYVAYSSDIENAPVVKEFMQGVELSKSMSKSQNSAIIDIVASVNGTILDTHFIMSSVTANFDSETMKNQLIKALVAVPLARDTYLRMKEAGVTALSYTYSSPYSYNRIYIEIPLDELLANIPTEETVSVNTAPVVIRAISALSTVRPITAAQGYKNASVVLNRTNINVNTVVSNSMALSRLEMGSLKSVIFNILTQNNSLSVLLPQLKNVGVTGFCFNFTAPNTSNCKWLFIHIDELMSGAISIDYAHDNGQQEVVNSDLTNNYLVKQMIVGIGNTRETMLQLPGYAGFDAFLKGNNIFVKITLDSESAFEQAKTNGSKENLIKMCRSNDMASMAYDYLRKEGVMGITYQYVLQGSSKEIVKRLHIYELITGIVVVD